MGWTTRWGAPLSLLTGGPARQELCLGSPVDGSASNEVAKTWALMHWPKLNRKSSLVSSRYQTVSWFCTTQGQFCLSFLDAFFLRQLYRPKGNLSCLEPEGKTHQSLKHFRICFRWVDWYNYARWEEKMIHSSHTRSEFGMIQPNNLQTSSILLSSPKQWVGILIGFSGNHISIFYRCYTQCISPVLICPNSFSVHRAVGNNEVPPGWHSLFDMHTESFVNKLTNTTTTTTTIAVPPPGCHRICLNKGLKR